jgi:hypothetical protein
MSTTTSKNDEGGMFGKEEGDKVAMHDGTALTFENRPRESWSS